MNILSSLAKGIGAIAGAARAGYSAEMKSLSPDMAAWVKGLDIPDNEQGAKLVSPYLQSTWVYTAVSRMAEQLSQIPFRISRVSASQAKKVRALRESSDPKHRAFCRKSLMEGIVEAGDVVDLFSSPHPAMDRTLFWAQIVSWDAMRGEFFVIPLDEQDQPVDLTLRNPRVKRMLTLDTSMFWHMVIGYNLAGWRYTGSPLMSPLPSEMLEPGEVIHCRNVNPYLFWRGMSPLQVAMLPASSDYAASMFMKGLLMNNADTGIIATTEQNLTPEQREQFMAALRERKRKAGTPDRPLFLSSGVKIEKPTISNVDMQFLETRRLLRQEVGAIYNVPESIMGFSEEKTSSLSGGGNALTAEKMSFIENNIGPKCHRYEAALDPIVKTFGDDLVGWFDIEGLPIMQESRRTRVDSAVKVFGMGVPFNEINQVYDLGFPKLPWGDKGWLPFSLQDANAEMEMPGEEDPNTEGPKPPKDENENEDENGTSPKATPFGRMHGFLAALQRGHAAAVKADRKRLWESHMRQRAGTVKAFESKFRRVLNEHRAKVLAKLGEMLPADKNFRAPALQRSLIDLIFDALGFGNELVLAVKPVQMGAMQEAADLLRKGELGLADPWKFPPDKALEFLAGREADIRGCGQTARDRLNTSLQEGLNGGEGLNELSDRVRAEFTAMSHGDARRIATTETSMAFNYARDVAMKDAGVEYKSWLSSHGPTVRPTHAEAEQRYGDSPIPVTEPFIVGGEELMYPGDPNGSPGNVINCQCIQLAVLKEEVE